MLADIFKAAMLPLRRCAVKCAYVAVAMLLWSPRFVTAGVTIDFDYRFDSTGFFSDPERRQTLSLAADAVNRWVDELLPIAQSGGNTWTGQVVRPDTGIGTFIPGSDLSIPANTLYVFPGARDLGATHLAVSEVNGTIASGSDAWKQVVRFRGQTPGPPYVDYGPWGGSISFNPAFDWHSSPTSTGLSTGQYDLFTVASHELLHVLGFGTASSYFASIQNGHFAGTNAVAVGSDTNPSLQMSPDGGHWAQGTRSVVTGASSLALVTPFIPDGARLRPTDLDLAALIDIGWQPAVAGDANRDGKVDFSDAFTLTNNYGLTDRAGWSDGDFNQDGAVNFSDAFELTNNFGLKSTPSSQGHVAAASLLYDPATGSVVFQGLPGEDYKSLRITSLGGHLKVGSAGWLGAATSFVVNTSHDQGFSTLAALGGTFSMSGTFSLGYLLDPALSEELLLSDLQLSYGVNGFAGSRFASIRVVPEPSAFGLASPFLLYLVASQRRLFSSRAASA